MRGLLLVVLAVTAFGVSRIAALPVGPSCCACLGVQLNATTRHAAFCLSVPAGNSSYTDAALRCAGVIPGRYDLACIEDDMTASCTAQLADQALIACPTSSVPVADPLNLLAMVVVLGATGAAVIRRRARRDR